MFKRTHILSICAAAGLSGFAAADAVFLYEDVQYTGVGNSLLNIENDEFHLEDFEDGTWDLDGVTYDAGIIVAPQPTNDSVDSGADGFTFWVQSAVDGVTFTFDEQVLGQLPQQVGLAWTDGVEFGLVTFEAWGAEGEYLGRVQRVLGDLTYEASGEEDRFFGVINLEGVSAMRISGVAQALEVDHIQFLTNIPAPGALALLGVAGCIRGRRRRA